MPYFTGYDCRRFGSYHTVTAALSVLSMLHILNSIILLAGCVFLIRYYTTQECERLNSCYVKHRDIGYS